MVSQRTLQDQVAEAVQVAVSLLALGMVAAIGRAMAGEVCQGDRQSKLLPAASSGGLPRLELNPGVQRCGAQTRALFEKAAQLHFSEDIAAAATALAEAQKALYSCLGRQVTVEQAYGEVERWFSFFSLHRAAELLSQGKGSEAVPILEDQEESYSPARAPLLGVLQDYGPADTARLYRLTREAGTLASAARLAEAAGKAREAADLQFALAVQRAGTPTPLPPPTPGSEETQW